MEKQSQPFRDWCKSVAISPSTGYELLKDGLGPKTYVVGTKRFVSSDAGSAWLREMEARPAPIKPKRPQKAAA